MLRVTTIHTGLPGMPGFSTFHFAGSTEGEATAARNAVNSFWDGIDGLSSNNWFATTQGEIPNIDPATGQITEMFSNTNLEVQGDLAGDALPFATQALIRWRTNTFVNGRELRGRTFIPGQLEASNVGGLPNATLTAAITAAGTVLTTNATGAGGLLVYSPTHFTTGLVTTWSTWSNWAQLRTRRD